MSHSKSSVNILFLTLTTSIRFQSKDGFRKFIPNRSKSFYSWQKFRHNCIHWKNRICWWYEIDFLVKMSHTILLGEWIGVILDEPKGKNNGSVRKKGMFNNLYHRELQWLILDGSLVKYFTCLDNHGLYVRPSQIEFTIDESDTHLSQSTSNHSVKSQSNGSENGQTKSSNLSSKQSNHRTSTRVSGNH